MGNIAVQVKDLSKRYEIGVAARRHDGLKELLGDVKGLFRRHRQRGERTIWALKNVSFEVRHGEILGLIGRNGAGKSTLLKILSRITEPTTGQAMIHGRVASLLEVGTGFQPELTGRENIYLNGAILGMKKVEIKRKFDEIVAFSDVEKFIDTPVKRYSSGMYTRLAFAVAAHLEPEILIVDEVLAVGDAAFQKKCLGKMQDVAKGGRTVLFVSHNMGAIAQLCERALWFEGGHLNLAGPPSDVVAFYLSSGGVTRGSWSLSPDRPSSAKFVFISARILSMQNQPTAVVQFDSQFYIEVAYDVVRPVKDLAIVIQVVDFQGHLIWVSWDTDNTDWKGGYVREVGQYRSVCKIPGRLLKPGAYRLSVGARSSEGSFDSHENVMAFDVSEVGYHLNQGRFGIITPVFQWEIIQIDGTN